MGSPAEGFTYQQRKSGTVVIFHHGRLAGTLNAEKGAAFLAELADVGKSGDQQNVMARATGNYKHSNERQHAKTATVRGSASA